MSYFTNSYNRRRSSGLAQKGVHGVYASQRSSAASYRPGIEGGDMNDTDFEEDSSDDEYSGRRSEDSGKMSDTTLSSFDELRTPVSQVNAFEGFQLNLDGPQKHSLPHKSVEGPVGPHLFRMSQDSTQEDEFYMTMSPIATTHTIPPQPEFGIATAITTDSHYQRQQQQQPQQQSATTSGSGPTPTLFKERRLDQLSEPPRTSVPLRTWSPQQVAEWMNSIGFERAVVETFFINDISGVTLIDLQYDDLKELGISSFGQRHKLWTEIKALKDNTLQSLGEVPLYSPAAPPNRSYEDLATNQYAQSAPEPVAEQPLEPVMPASVTQPFRGRGIARLRAGPDDLISPAESVSIVAIEQLLPKQHKCSKGENCSKWQRQQRKLAQIATEIPALAQITQAQTELRQQPQRQQQLLPQQQHQQQQQPPPTPGSPVESGVGTAVGGASVVVPSVIASSDLFGPAKPSVRLEEDALQNVQSRDPQESVRQFLQFQHVNNDAEDDDEEDDYDDDEEDQMQQSPIKRSPSTPKYEMFPPLSPPTAYPQHSQLSMLPRLTIPNSSADPGAVRDSTFSPNRTARPPVHDIYRIGSPASEMDVPVTAIPSGPIERDVSSSVPPDMRFGAPQRLSRSASRGHGAPPMAFLTQGHHYQQVRGLPSGPKLPRAQSFGPASGAPLRRSNSLAGRAERQRSITQALIEENDDEVDVDDGATEIADDLTPTTAKPKATLGGTGEHQGYMKKRKTKMLRHEWNESHFRLQGTQLAMHKDAHPDAPRLDCIDVDDYAVAISSSNSKLNSALKRLHINAPGKGPDPGAFAFQLVPSFEPDSSAAGGNSGGKESSVLSKKAGLLHAATAKTHHFAVKSQTERIDWMRELMLARARKNKDVVHASFE